MKRPILYAAGALVIGGGLYGVYHLTMNTGPDPDRIREEVNKAIPELEEQGITFAEWELQDDNILVFTDLEARFDAPEPPMLLTVEEARMTVTMEGALRNRMNDFQASGLELSDADSGTVGLKAASASAPWIGLEDIEGKGLRPNYEQVVLHDLSGGEDAPAGEMTLESMTFSEPRDGLPRLTVLKEGKFAEDGERLTFESLEVAVRPELIEGYSQPDYAPSESGVPELLGSFETITAANVTLDTDDIDNETIDDLAIETALDDEDYANFLKITASGEEGLGESLEEGTDEYKIAQIVVGPEPGTSEMSLSVSLDRAQGTMKVGPTRFAISDSFDIGLTGNLEGIAMDDLSGDPEQQLENLMLRDLSLDVADQGIIDRYLDFAAEEEGMPREELETMMLTGMTRTFQGSLGLEPEQVEALTSFIRTPGQSGTLTITLNEPAPLVQVALAAAMFPRKLVENADIQIAID